MKLMFVYRSGGVWHASKPADEGWLELFGSDTLPTVQGRTARPSGRTGPYRAETPPEEVVSALEALNPDFDIIVVCDP